MMSFINRLFQTGTVVLAALFCVSSVWGQSHSDFLASLIDQKMLLLHIGDQEKVKIKRQDLHKLTTRCDMAVQLKRAEWGRGKAHLWFQNIGHPAIAGWLHRATPGEKPSCPMDYGHVELELTGFQQNEAPAAVEAAVREILLTPEEYMAAHGVSFDLPPGRDDETAIKCVSPVVPVKPLFTVDPEFSDQARKAKYQGTVKIGMVVGSDGRVHKPRVTAPLGMGLDETSLAVLSMWRFQPGTQAGKPIACETMVETSFNLY